MKEVIALNNCTMADIKLLSLAAFRSKTFMADGDRKNRNNHFRIPAIKYYVKEVSGEDNDNN